MQQSQRPHPIQVPLNLVWATVLTALTGVLGAAPLKVLRNALNPMVYPVLTFTLAAMLFLFGSPYLAALILSQALLIGVYAECEEHGMSIVQAAGLALATTMALLSGATYLVLSYKGKAALATVTKDFEAFSAQVQALNPDLGGLFVVDKIMQVLPSLAVIFLIFSLAAAIILEKTFSRWMGIKPVRREKLNGLSAPDYLIWVLIGALLFANVPTGWASSKFIGQNALYICAAIYFLQGMAVMFKVFEIFKFGTLSKFLFVFLFAVQFQVVLAIIGIVDYWADFRKLLLKKTAAANRRVG